VCGALDVMQMIGFLSHPLPALHKAAKNDQPIHIHPDNGKSNDC
jgi:hypothetical protein